MNLEHLQHKILKVIKSKPVIYTITTLVLTGAILFAFYLGMQRGFAETKNIVIQGVSGGETPESISSDFSVFWQAWDKLKTEHVNSKDIKDQNLVYGAIKGLTESISDPYTEFFTPKDYKTFKETIGGNFSGIGAEIGIRNDQLVVIAPLKNSPSEKAGILAGDMILRIDAKTTDGLNIGQAVQIIRGETDTKVTLNILRKGWTKPKDFIITRSIINIPTIDYEMKGDIAYVQLYNFDANTETVFYNAAKDILLDKKARGMILDMRNNPGGYLDVAVNMAGWFIPKGDVVVKEKYADGKVDIFKANGNSILKDMPVVVIINGGSASAAEILAGALRINRKIQIVGEKSFGKGSVQELQTLKDDSAVKITVAKWLLPDDSAIDKVGLVPDITVALTENDINSDKDPQLDKALELVQKQLEQLGQ